MADSPKLSESSQALFCAVVDYLGKPINGRDRPANYPAFQRKYGSIVDRVKGKVKTGTVSVTSIEKYLTENRISYYWNYKYNLKKSFTKANTSSAPYIIIIGENEFNGDFFTIKNLTTGEQKELRLNQILNHLNDKSR